MRSPTSFFRGAAPVALLFVAALTPLHAAPTPHPDHPDRLVETRDGFSVEYSPGQEAWMEMAFQHRPPPPSHAAAGTADHAPLAASTPPAPADPRAEPPVPGSPADLRARRSALLTAVARQTGLPRATDLQGRVFDTFLGYYEMLAAFMENVGRELPARMAVRRVAIWQRDDLIRRLRAGAKIPGMSYDAATDTGQFDFTFPLQSSAFSAGLKDIQAAIDAQRINHRFSASGGTYSASVDLAHPPAPRPIPPPAADLAADPPPDITVPIIYRGELATPPSPHTFSILPQFLDQVRAAFASQVASYRDATQVGIILHETAEIGLLENVIGSPDRRWLCEGTANYTAWRVARDLWGADFADDVYPLDAQLRQFAAQQPAIDLAAWTVRESQPETESSTVLDRARYAFATRAIFLLAQRHGADALARLWSDVARTPRAKTSAQTFAAAYRRHFHADLAALLRDAEQLPLPPPPGPTPATQ